MKCKVINCNRNDLEKQVNEWIESGTYEIKNVSQTSIDDYVTYTILYYEKNELRKIKLEKIKND